MKIWLWIKDNIFSIDEKKSLHENWSFWSAITLPFIPALLSAFPLFEEVTLQSNITVKGYVIFVENFSLPLWVASSSLVFGVMIGRFHGSKQRAKAIEQRDIAIVETRKQNEVSNYLNHRDHFHKYLQAFVEAKYKGLMKVDTFKIYSIVFSNSTPYSIDITMNDNLYKFYEKQFNELFWEELKKPSYLDPDEISIFFQNFSKSIGILSIAPAQQYNVLKNNLVIYQEIYSAAIEYSSEKINFLEATNNSLISLINDFDNWAKDHLNKNL